MIVIETPIKARLIGYDDKYDKVRELLTYYDKKVDYEIKRVRNAKWMVGKLGEDRYRELLEDLDSQRVKVLVFEDSGGLWTYSGLAKLVANHFADTIRSEIVYPESKLIPWANIPPPLRHYQTVSVEKLLEQKHGAIELGTGLGKSLILMHLVKELGLRAVLATPSTSIATQCYELALRCFGPSRVGRFFDGKKDAKKMLTVATAQSLVKIVEGSPVWDLISQSDVLLFDEAHLTPAVTFEKLCLELFSKVPYRFFVSGTQFRNDGLDLVLKGITGPIVHEMSVQEGVEQGFLAKPKFHMFRIESPTDCATDDIQKCTRKHFYQNPNVLKAVGQITAKMVKENRPTLVLVDEFSQFTALLPFMRVPVKFAHGGIGENKNIVPKEYWDSDPVKLVESFNAGEIPVLVGTSCVSTGTDFKNLQAIVYLVGGKSEIAIKQAVGRGTRTAPGKKDCLFIDFDIVNVFLLHRHAISRKETYNSIYGPVTVSDHFLTVKK